MSFVAYNVAAASSTEEQLRELLGGYYDVPTSIPTTPIKTKKITEDIISPKYKRALALRKQSEQEFESTKAELEATKQQLSERDERIAQLEMQISESLSTIADLVNKNQELRGKITDKNVALQRLKDMLRKVHEQLDICDKQVADFETTTELDD